MQYIKQFASNYLFGWSKGKEIDLKDYVKTDEKPIGGGAFGNVYKVQSKKDNQMYAAKVSKQGSFDPKSFTRELEILIKITHPTILSFEGYSLTDFSGEPNPTILTKFAENGSLRHLLSLEERGLAPENWNNTAKYIILYGIAKGMSFLHKSHYIHRDLKPENILIDEFLYPQISDFGLSKWFDPDGMSQLTTNIGTVAYMAPEIFRGQKYDQSVDVYSYSFIMYELLTGKKIFEKNTSNFNWQKKIDEGYRPSFPENTDLHEDVIKLIKDCWSSEPSLRPSFDNIVDFLTREETMSSFNIDEDAFNYYLDTIEKVQSSSSYSVAKLTEDYISRSSTSSIRRVDISESYAQYSRQKIIEYESELNKFSIYPPSKLIFLDEKCQNLVKLAQSGDSNMMVAVAESLINGIHGFPKDVETGVKFLKSATELNNVEASELYASLLIEGNIIPPNIEKAEQIVDFLLKENSPNAKKLWAKIELTKSSPDYAKVKNYLKESAADGNVESMILYAKFCLMKREETQIEPDQQEAEKYMKLAAESGNQDAKKMIDDILKSKEEEERKRREEEERRRREEDERRRREDERRREEEERRRREEERRRREEEERRRREEEERRRREEEERRWREAHQEHYYPRCNPNSRSIVDSLKSIGVDSSFSNRTRIANRNGIGNYVGSYDQNVHMLSLLKNGQLIQP